MSPANSDRPMHQRNPEQNVSEVLFSGKGMSLVREGIGSAGLLPQELRATFILQNH